MTHLAPPGSSGVLGQGHKSGLCCCYLKVPVTCKEWISTSYLIQSKKKAYQTWTLYLVKIKGYKQSLQTDVPQTDLKQDAPTSFALGA